MEIEGYSNYLIYPEGRVWSKKTKRFLKPGSDKRGYLHVALCKDGKPKTTKIHRLVAEHYIPNDDNKREVDHIDRNKHNNDVTNLRWTTSSENQQNRGIMKTNTSGHKYISAHKVVGYIFVKEINKKSYRKYFKTLKDAICYKYIITLKIKCGLI